MLTEFCDITLQVEAIVGGISIDKQIRILRRCPEILVATPGRLWQLIEFVCFFYYIICFARKQYNILKVM